MHHRTNLEQDVVKKLEESNLGSPHHKPAGKPPGLCHGRDDSQLELNAGVMVFDAMLIRSLPFGL